MAELIRLAAEADAAAIATIYRPYVDRSRITFEEQAPDAAAIAERMASPLHPWLVAEVEDEVIGFASTSAMRGRAAYRWSVETGLYVAEDAQGRGFGRALLGAHLELLERQAGVERGVGFKLGQWVDVAPWQRELAPRTSAPTEPLAYAALA